MATKKAPVAAAIEELDQREMTVRIIGTTPMYFNRMAEKARRALFIGGGKKTAAEKKAIKHEPELEYRSSVYRINTGPTLLGFPAPAIKGAMATAALETGGVTKTSVNRLIYLPDERIKIWGIPQLKCDVVRSADMNKTPDIRTRAYLPEWASEFRIRFVQPTLNPVSVTSLLVNAGIVCGIGDFRIEKGKGSYGGFRIVSEENEAGMAEFNRIVSEQGRDAQEYALQHPDYADEDTNELMQMMLQEREDRGESMMVAAQ